MGQAGAWPFFEVRDGHQPRDFCTKAPFLITTTCVGGYHRYLCGDGVAVLVNGRSPVNGTWILWSSKIIGNRQTKMSGGQRLTLS